MSASRNEEKWNWIRLTKQESESDCNTWVMLKFQSCVKSAHSVKG